MPVTKTWAGGTFNLPQNREPKGSWGTEVSNFLISLANNALALTGGTQTLSAELNFGATYGLVSAYVKSASANIASSGMLRLAKGDSVAWRNNANGADLALGVNASDRLTFGGVAVPTISSTDTLTAKTIVVSSNTITTAASGNLVSTELNAALSELQTHIDTKATSATVTAHTGASSGVHGVTGSVVGTTDTQTLTNKTLSTGTKMTGGLVTTAVAEVDPADNTKQWNADLSTSTTGTSTTFKMAQTTNRTLTFPDATDTLVGKATTDNLTNKTLTSATLTTPTQTSYQDLTEVATPAAPAASKLRLYAKSDDQLYVQTSAGVEKVVGSGSGGGSGQKNYIASTAQSTGATWTGYGTVTAGTDVTPADLPRANTTATGWKLTPSGSTSGTFTVTLATPGVFTASAHGMLTGYTVTPSTTGALPTGLTAGTVYYVNVVSSSTFNVATSMANLIAGTYVATSGSQSGTHSFTFGGAYLRFTLDAADYNVKQQLQWAQNILSGTTGDWEVDVYSNTAANYSGTYTRLPLSTDDPTNKNSALPNLEGTYRTTFDAPGSAAQYIELRWNKLAANTHALVGSDLISGPGTTVQGAAVSAPVTFTSVLSIGAKGTVTTDVLSYTRIGQWALIKWSYVQSAAGTAGAGSYLLSMPTGLTVDTTQAPVGKFEGSLVGKFAVSGTSSYTGFVHVSSSTQLGFIIDTGAGADSQWSGTTSGANLASTALNIGFEALVPINEWAGSGTVNVAQNDIQYASNSDSSSTATNTASFAYGLSGSLIPNGAVGTTYQRRVRFQAPVPVGASPWIEVLEAGTGCWVKLIDRIGGQIYQGSAWYGGEIQSVSGSTTDFDVYFGPNGIRPTGATYGSNGQAWSSLSTWYWRLAVGLPGQAVGFGIVQPGVSSGLVSASGVPGNTTGNAIAATYVGEMPVGSQRSGTGGFTFSTRATATPSGSFASQVSATLNAGVYLVTVSAAAVNTGGTLGYQAYLAVGGTQVTNTFFLQAPVNDEVSLTFTIPVVITTNSTAVALFAKDTGTTSAPGVQELWAVRIA